MKDRQRLEGAVAAVESIYSLPRKLITSVVQDLLNQYGGWAHIEADNFHLLVDTCFQRMEEEATIVESFPKVKTSSEESLKSKTGSENFAQEESGSRPRRLKRVGLIETSSNQTTSPNEATANSVLLGAAGGDLSPSSVKEAKPRAGTSMGTVGSPFQARLPRRASSARKSPYTATAMDMEVHCKDSFKSEVGPIQASVRAEKPTVEISRDRATEPMMELSSVEEKPAEAADGGGSIHSWGKNAADASLHRSSNGDNSKQTCEKAGLVMVKEKPRALSFIAEYYDEESS